MRTAHLPELFCATLAIGVDFMKKIIVCVIMCVLILSGCSLKKTKINGKGAETPPGIAADFGSLTAADDGQKNMAPVIGLEDVAGAILKTNFGDVKLKFYADESPKTVTNFINLMAANFYNGVKFHRVIKGFMVQSGDPNSKDNNWEDDGFGGPGYIFPDEFNDHKLVRGSLAMANSGIDTNGSQFFIITAEATPHLDGVHTNFGYVVDGFDVLDMIENVATNENDHPTRDIIIENVAIELTETGKAKTEAQKQQQPVSATTGDRANNEDGGAEYHVDDTSQQTERVEATTTNIDESRNSEETQDTLGEE